MYIIIGKDKSKFTIASKEYLEEKNLIYSYREIKNINKSETLWTLKPRSHLTLPIIYYDNKYIGGYYDLINHLL